MAVLLGLASALSYGIADFLGGLSSKRNPVVSVVLVSQAFGAVLLVAALPLVPGSATGRALGWGAASGVAGAIGIGFLYRGLARGRMSVVAPVTAVISASVPVLFGLLTGDRPSALELGGMAAAIVAVALVPSGGSTASAAEGIGTSGLPDAVASGIGIGLFLIALDAAGESTGLWPLVGARIASILIFGAAVHWSGKPVRPAPGTLRTVLGAGALDVTANALYLMAVRRGLLSLVAVLVSLYPAPTVVLARVILRERLGRIQMVGLACAAAGVALIAAG